MHSPAVTERHLRSTHPTAETSLQRRLHAAFDRSTREHASDAGMAPPSQFAEILLMYSRGNYQDIIRRNIKVLSELDNSVSPVGRLLLGNSYYYMGDFASALKQYRILVDSVDESYAWFRSRVYTNIGACLMRESDFRSALVCFEQQVPNHVDINGFLCATSLGDFDEARTQFLRWISAATRNISIVKTAASILINSGIASHDWISRALESSYPTLSDMVESAKIQAEFQFGSTGVSIDTLEGKTSIIPGLRGNLMFIGNKEGSAPPNRFNEAEIVNMAVDEGNVDKKLAMYDEASRLSADCWESRFNTGLILMSQSKSIESSLLHFTSIPHCAHAIYQRAQIYEKSKITEALKLYTELVASSRYRNDAGLLERIGYIYDKLLDNRLRAYRYYLDAFAVDPSRYSVLVWLGRHCEQTEDFETAINHYEILSEIDSSAEEWLRCLVRCYKQIGDMKSAKRIADRIQSSTEFTF